MKIEDINKRLSALRFSYCVSEYKTRQVLNAYLEANDIYSLGDSDLEDLFSYVEALRLPEIEEDGSDDIDILTIASAIHKQFTLAELASFPIPLPRKASGFFETRNRVMLNPKKIKDHYDMLERLVENYNSDNYLVESLVRGVTVYHRYEKGLNLSFFSYDKCYISKIDGAVYGHLFFNRHYTKERVCALIPALVEEEFKFYNGTLPYVKDKSISEVLSIVRTIAFVEKCEKRNNYIGSVFYKELKDFKREMYEEGSEFIKELRSKRIIAYSEKKYQVNEI